MAGFSNVDASDDVDHLVDYLRMADAGLAGIKAYMADTARRLVPGGIVLDLGCGLGFDLARLGERGLDGVGFDSSMEMLRRGEAVASRGRGNSGCADIAALPVRTASVDGCRAERVLQHVLDPALVVSEIARVLRPGGIAMVFEPDYGEFTIASELDPDGLFLSSLLTNRHPRIGAQLPDMFEDAGFRIDDVVTERSVGYALPKLPVSTERVLARAIDAGRCDAAVAERWVREQRARTAAGTFRAYWVKVLVVATLT